MDQILLIDDNPLQLRTREGVLRTAGLGVTVVTSAEAALRLLQSSLAASVGVVVTDHLLAGATGADLVRQLRAAHNAIPVIVISGLAEAETEYDGLHVVFRTKPCPPAELIALVRQHLRQAA